MERCDKPLLVSTMHAAKIQLKLIKLNINDDYLAKVQHNAVSCKAGVRAICLIC